MDSATHIDPAADGSRVMGSAAASRSPLGGFSPRESMLERCSIEEWAVRPSARPPVVLVGERQQNRLARP